ncbi:MAG: leucine-rich repeat domain-containing protein [Ruminococcaceae bacterium]|nr:leucine-rich repeat domain-containing protein [Oscillospiraceae bacterium]
MKKKIFLALAISALLVCLFAVGVSAAGSTSDEFAATPDTLEGVAVPTKLSTSERVVLLGSDGKYYTYPTYYVLKDQTSASFTVNNALNTALGYAEGTNLNSYVVRIEYPVGITYINTDLNYKSNLKYVKMSDTITDTAAKAFQGCTSMETIILSNSLTTLQNDLCKGNSKITSLVIPASVTKINGYCFDGCKISSLVNYAENVTSISGNAFSGCPITEFNFPDKLTSIGQYAFNGAQFTEVDLPNTITSLGSGVFQGCTNLTYIRLPESLTQIPHDFLKGTGSSSITIVVPKGCTSIYSQYSLGNSGIKSIIFTGDSDDAFVASVQEKASGWVSKITYANHCEYYYDNVHDIVFEEGNTCCGECSRCGSFKMHPNPIHAEEIVLAFGTGVYVDEVEEKTTDVNYYANMYVLHVCKNCENETADTEEYAPIFVKIGYSAEEEDTTSISFFTSINYASLLKYEEIADTKLQYGLIVSAAASSTPIKSVVDGAIELNASTVKVSMTDTEYAKFSVRISKLPANQTLNCCGYVIENDKVTYLGHESTSAEAEIIDHAGVIELTK